ncbi:MAG TPA: trypsin-like peptidase domain-containing protein [Jatrophihabitans sp.]|nr:trypsin-like peptidase domain-containing protein [Jatrophihabitans sp.]
MDHYSQRTRPPLSTRIRAAILGAAVLVGVAACTSSGKSGGAGSASTSASATGSAQQPAVAVENEFVSTVHKTLPSVVEITTSTGLGSGVIIDQRGDVVTNAHVVGTAKTFTVGLYGGKQLFHGSLVGVFAPDDLAVIRIQGASNLQPITFGDSSKMQVGDIVMAIGNPLGLASSVTEGIVSATGRTVTEPAEANSPGATIPDAIQTSAAINPGNSGGALVDLDGRLVGIPTLAAVDPQIGQGGSAAPGIGFAISANMAHNVATQLVSKGEVTNSGRAALGVTVATAVGPNGAPAGAAIVSVMPNGPAAKAGLRPGDVITRIDSFPITSTASLADALANYAPGQTVHVTVITDTGKVSTVTVQLGQLTGH